jgi:hypothetical protein
MDEEYHVNEHPGHNKNSHTKHPFSSSELFNAFSYENQRENKTIGVSKQSSKWTENVFTPPSMVMKSDNHMRV